jgi:hypothetical protein
MIAVDSTRAETGSKQMAQFGDQSMDARRLIPFLGLVIGVSTSITAMAQYPVGPVTFPQHMVMIPHGIHSMPVMTVPQGAMPNMVPGGNSRPMLAAGPIRGLLAGAQQQRQHPGQAVAESENFIVFASDQSWANEVVKTAEALRRDLADHWLGKELPPWSGRCPIHVNDGPKLGAGGETRFIVEQGTAHNWMMTVHGTRERILDSVLPHEISHTIFATHFGRYNKYVPRWADEGSATTVEHESEKSKHRHFLRQFLQTGRGLAFNKMFQLKEYPKDILPLYAQGHSAVQFLIDQSDPKYFVKFLEQGMKTDNWSAALAKFYEYKTVGEFQDRWNKWLHDGSPFELASYAPLLLKTQQNPIVLASNSQPMRNRSPNNSGRLADDPRSLELQPENQHQQPTQTQAGQAQTAPASGLALVSSENELDSSDGSVATNSQGSLLSFEQAIELSKQTNQPSGDSVALNTKRSTGESWFKQRLRQTSGQPANPIPQHNNFPADNSNSSTQQFASEHKAATQMPAGLRPAARAGAESGFAAGLNNGPSAARGTATALPQSPQGVGVQVLDWGNGLRLSGSPNDNISSPRYR